MLLQLDKPLQDEIVHGTLKLYLDPTYQPEKHTTVVGKVVGLPKFPSGENSSIVKHLKEGDEVVFSYSVVANRTFSDISGSFTEVTGGNPDFQKFMNGKGEKLQIVAYPGAIAKKWAGIHLSSSGEWISGVQGTESEMERWKAQFDFGEKNHNYIFKNKLEVDGNDYWKASYLSIFAKIVDGKVVSIGDRCIMEPIDIDVTKQIRKQNNIFLPPNSVQARLYDRAILVSGGKDIGLKKGDNVSFQSQYVEKYEIQDKEYFLIKKTRVLGKWKKHA